MRRYGTCPSTWQFLFVLLDQPINEEVWFTALTLSWTMTAPRSPTAVKVEVQVDVDRYHTCVGAQSAAGSTARRYRTSIVVSPRRSPPGTQPSPAFFTTRNRSNPCRLSLMNGTERSLTSFLSSVRFVPAASVSTRRW